MILGRIREWLINMKNSIKIGDVKCNLDDMPKEFRKRLEDKLKEEDNDLKNKLDKLIESENNTESNNPELESSRNLKAVDKKLIHKDKSKAKKIPILRKMFGYKSGIFEKGIK